MMTITTTSLCTYLPYTSLLCVSHNTVEAYCTSSAMMLCYTVPLLYTLLGSPNKPNLKDMQINTTSLYLSWEDPANNNAPILVYEVTLELVDSERGDVIMFTSNTTELYVDGLTPFTVYSVQVVAVNSVGSSTPSELLIVMTAEGGELVCMHSYIHGCVL